MVPAAQLTVEFVILGISYTGTRTRMSSVTKNDH